MIDDLQNVNSLCFCTYFSYLYFTNNIHNIDIIAIFFLTMDMFFSTPEAIAHHILAVSFAASKRMYNISNADSEILSVPFIKTEISTIFLILKIMYEQKTSDSIKNNWIAKIFHKINDVTFVTTFFSFRIVGVYSNLIGNPETYKIIDKYADQSHFATSHFYITMFGLCALNVYWFSIICKKIYKQIVISNFPRINTNKFAERVLPWTLFASFLPYILNGSNLSRTQIFDVVGITVLSFASFNYHKYKSVMFDLGKDVYIQNSKLIDGMHNSDEDGSALFFLNQGSIHLKYVLTTMAMGSNATYSSFMVHSIFYVGSWIYATHPLQIVEHAYETDKESARHMSNLDLFVFIPGLYDFYNVIGLVNERSLQMEITMSIVILCIIAKIRPFYQINHIAVHFAAILHTWVLARTVCSMK